MGVLDILDGNELRFVIRCSGSVIPKGLVWAIPAAAFATLLHHFLETVGIKNDVVAQDAQIWTTFYYVLGVLLVFRTNQAYSRYWEGATLLQQVRGEWFNAVSSLFAFCAKDKNKEEVERFQHLLVRLMSLLYCTALQKIALIPPEKFETISTDGMDAESMAFLETSEEQCEVLVHWIQRLVIDGYNTGVIQVPAPILSRVFQELSRGVVNAENVRKIAEVPFPFPYTQMSIVMLLASSILTPLLASITSRTSWEAGFLAFMPVLTFWCLNYMAAEIEQPFGEDANDLPIPEMVIHMNNSLRKLTHPATQAVPKYQYERRAHSRCDTQTRDHHNVQIPDRDCGGRFLNDFSKRRSRSKRHSSNDGSPAPLPPRLQRSSSRCSTAPPDCRSPEIEGPLGEMMGRPQPPRGGPAELLQVPRGGPAELLQVNVGAAGYSVDSSRLSSVQITTMNAEFRASPGSPVPVDRIDSEMSSWPGDDEDRGPGRPGGRNPMKKPTFERPPGWNSRGSDSRAEQPKDRLNAAVPVVPAATQIGSLGQLRLGPSLGTQNSRRNVAFGATDVQTIGGGSSDGRARSGQDVSL